MTSLAFILGVVPLAMATGAGAASQRAVGLGVLGGMLAATPFAVMFVPTFFVVVLGLFKTKPRLLGAELKAFEEEQAAKKAAEASGAQLPAQPHGGQEGRYESPDVQTDRLVRLRGGGVGRLLAGARLQASRRAGVRQLAGPAQVQYGAYAADRAGHAARPRWSRRPARRPPTSAGASSSAIRACSA